MNRTPLLLVLLVIVTGMGAFLVWSGDDPPDVRPDASGVTAEVVADDASTDGGGIVASVELDPGSIDESVPDDFLRADATIENQSSGQPLVMQVWQGRKGVPAPDAEVFMLDGFEGPELEDPFAQHWSALAEGRGDRFVADAEGRVELPPVQEWAIVTARLPGSYGFAKVGRDHGEVETVILRHDETVTVRVVDGEGRTRAGVPVGVVQRVPARQSREQLMARMKELRAGMDKVRQWMAQNPDQRERAAPKAQGMRKEMAELNRELGGGDRGGRGDRGARAAAQRRNQQQKKAPVRPDTRVEQRARRRTDEDGLAVFRHFQLYRNWGKKWWPQEHRDQFQAVLLMPLQQPQARAFTGRPVPEEIIELRMPDTGSIALRTVDRDGRPFTHPVHAGLGVDSKEAPSWSRMQVRKEQNEAAIVFPFVGLGLRFLANCRLDDEDFRWRAPLFLGPTRPGERVVVDLVVAPGEGMLFGRLFDAAGNALADEEIMFLINGMAGRLEGEEVLLDENGRFHLPYQMRPNHQPPFNLQIRRPGVVPVAGLSMPLESLPRAHVTDIGELRLDGLGVVAQGIVVDDRGQPIPGARVQLHRERNVGRQAVQMKFVEEAFANAEADAEGRFALFGELENARYRLHVEAKEHFEVWTPDLRRDGPQQIEMQRKSRLLGTVLRPTWLLAKGVRAELVLANDPKQRREDQIHDYKGKTFTYFDWVRPGVYDLTLRTSQFPDPFLRIDRLVIEPGQMGVHPRIRDLDLGAYLYRFEIFAVDENGQSLQPRRPLLARIQRPNGRSGHVGFVWQKGRVEMFSTSPQADVIAMADGYAIQPAIVAAGRNEVRFLKTPPVDLQFAGLKALAGTTNVQVILEALDTGGLPEKLEVFDGGSKRIAGWYARARYAAAPLGDNDIARVQLTRQGSHKVTLRFGVRQGIRPTAVELAPIDIQVQPGAGPQRHAVGYDLQVVQGSIAEAAQKIAANQ